MEERKELKQSTTERDQKKYRQLENKINTTSKETFMQNQYKEIYDHLTEAVFITVNNFFGKQRMKTGAVQANDGQFLYDQEDTAKR